MSLDDVSLVDPVASAATATPVEERTAGGRLWAHLRHHPSALCAAGFLVLLTFVAVFAPVLVPHDPNRGDLTLVYRSPGGGHLLGTDALGRDVLSRLLAGARTSLVAATEVVVISATLGTLFGVLAGYCRGWVDTACSRINDSLMSVPGLLLALAIVAVLGPGLTNAMVALGIAFSPRFFRVARSAAIDVRHRPFIECAVAMGCSTRRIVFVHVLPNILSPLLIAASMSFGAAIVAESGLSFLGLGVTPPTASWGGMVAVASDRLDLKYLLLAPGLALAVTVTAFTVFGDAVREAYRPGQGGSRG